MVDKLLRRFLGIFVCSLHPDAQDRLRRLGQLEEELPNLRAAVAELRGELGDLRSLVQEWTVTKGEESKSW